MPAFFYPGDNFAIRAETANWVNTGELGIDYSHRAELGGMLAERGQYFYENDAKEKFFSRYGFGDTVLFVPPYAVYKAIHGPVKIMGSQKELLFIINIYMILFVTASAGLLYLIAGLLSSKYWIRAAFTLASLYATFCTHYLKQPLHENFQITLSLAFFYFSLRFFMHEGEEKPWWTIGAASLAAGALMTTKSSFVLYFAALGLTLLIDGFSRHGKNFKEIIWKPMGKYILWIGIPAALALAVVLISNAIRFGDLLNSGYGQWINNHKFHYMSLSLMKQSIPGFLWQKGNANIFLHYPLFAISLPGLFILYRKNQSAFWLIVTVFLPYFLVICAYASWRGEWCYGPRHLLFILMSGSIPAIFLLEKVSTFKPSNKWIVLGVSAVVLSVSTWNHFQVNTIQCFAYYQLSSVFNQTKIPAISNYFKEYTTRGNIYRDIRLHAKGKETFPPLQEIRYLPNAQRAYAQLNQMVNYFGKPNYYFQNQK